MHHGVRTVRRTSGNVQTLFRSSSDPRPDATGARFLGARSPRSKPDVRRTDGTARKVSYRAIHVVQVETRARASDGVAPGVSGAREKNTSPRQSDERRRRGGWGMDLAIYGSGNSLDEISATLLQIRSTRRCVSPPSTLPDALREKMSGSP